MIILQTHIVPEVGLHVRLLDYAGQFFNGIPSRAALKKAIKRGEILVDGQAAESGKWVEAGQKIEWVDTERKVSKPFLMQIDVIFEDDFLAIVNKPPGISTSGNKFKTIQNALAGRLKLSGQPDALRICRPVHRLDYSTSGLLLVAKTSSTLTDLGRQFENREIKKRYRAIVVGKMEGEGEFNSQVNGQDAITRYSVVRTTPSLHTDWITLLDLFPLTGRTHQIRVHLAEAGHPVLGDKKYGPGEKALQGKGLFLASVELSFTHPQTKNAVEYTIPQPEKFNSFPEREIRRWKKYQV